MGGHAFLEAFNGHVTKRLSVEEYKRVSHEIINLLVPLYDVVTIPKSMPGKESYGDVDVIVANQENNNPFIHQYLISNSKVTKSIRNGNIFSIEYDEYQIDIINVAMKELPLSLYFLSFGDVGMIMGMILSVFGIGFGCHGLFLYLNDTKLLLSKDLDNILLFLGLSKQQWEQGFQQESEVFDYIMSSWIFRHSLFQRRENYNEEKKNSKMNRLEHRIMYSHFIEYVNQYSSVQTEQKQDRLDKEIVQSKAIHHFHKQDEINNMNEMKNRKKIIKEKFNGILVNQWTGLVNKEMGEFMKQCKSKWTEEEFYEMSITEIENQVKILYMAQ